MDTVTRRRFLLASGVTGAAGLAAGAAALDHRTLQLRAAETPLAGDANVLVLVTLYGGNDGLNTVVPYGDKAYQDGRPDLAYAESAVHRLGDGLGLNPALKGMAGLWAERRLAIVRGVGYPRPDFSHFRSMDIWQTASPTTPVPTGWIGRWLDATGDDPVRAVNVGSVLAPAAVGARCTAAALDADQARLRAAFAPAVTQLAVPASGEKPARAAVRTSYRNERTVATTFATALGPSAPRQGSGQGGGASRKAGHSGQSSNALADQLTFVGRCVRAGVPTRVYLVSLGGFDTHADEKGTQEKLLSTLDEAVAGFVTDMAADERGRRVVVAVYSEFGRRVVANGGDGTDHGTAGPVFVAGAPVRGGFYGEQPSLTDLDDGNLKSSVDFRAVYGELVHRVLASDPHAVLDTVPAELGFLA
ncbi:Uncharacterized conserved protein, DUF1501 family [Jatrophihabitans endophyticus]|uniref:Uncharacterized conserved protein, DUF1501 family n=1 Tax=Jatrophihabitans endophyticus TaxID=1206085 RepID=A0A1M5HGZ8_9ACTN|nr:DUF1501 domain-containing protein [Jatrophihabitans endophyticus]SHG15201.1 Uncharacterized conserved protein, DUF1501 family [Jatrophihabitans endophyticus]